MNRSLRRVAWPKPVGAARHLVLRLPVLVLVLGFTAIPAELRHPRAGIGEVFALSLDLGDIVANLILYLPVGAVFATRTIWPAVGVAAAVSGLAETSQLFTATRTPSVIDLTVNVIGAAIGWSVSSRWRIPSYRLGVGRRGASVAAILGVGYLSLGTSISPGKVEDAISEHLRNSHVVSSMTNPRGATSPGRLEASWKFDELRGGVARDSSGNGLDGRLVHAPAHVAGVEGGAVRLRGVGQWVDFGSPTALRLAGSLTISAWINSSAFPWDDAAIVSDLDKFVAGLGTAGYQLDTTIDRGRRTIGFKLTNASGRLMARYGRTSLAVNRWYYVAGVYDSEARTLDVYLNGRLDNGCLLGTVTDRQRASGTHVYVGRRSGYDRFAFAGSIDHTRVFSRVLTRQEIASDMKVSMPGRSTLEPATGDVRSPSGRRPRDTVCTVAERRDVRSAGLFVAFGLLIAFSCAGLWPTANYRLPCLLLSLGGGVLLEPMVAATTPTHFRVVIPLLTLLGGASVALSMRTERDETDPTGPEQ